MTGSLKRALCGMATLAILCGTVAMAQEHEQQHGEEHGGQGRAAHAEPHQGPHGYQRAPEPHGWNNRPKQVDRPTYEHNYQAKRSYRIGPYHRPNGWAEHRWVHGEVLPRAYWAPEYVIGDYWLFALEVPPVGYEWVRDDTDALLVNLQTGEILQVEYGVFG